jgi:hypothetical protein
MYILDTDHLSLIQRNGLEGKRILTRLAAIENNAILLTRNASDFGQIGELQTGDWSAT